MGAYRGGRGPGFGGRFQLAGRPPPRGGGPGRDRRRAAAFRPGPPELTRGDWARGSPSEGRAPPCPISPGFQFLFVEPGVGVVVGFERAVAGKGVAEIGLVDVDLVAADRRPVESLSEDVALEVEEG